MRVLFLTHSFPRQLGDTPGSFVLRLASALRAEGFDTRVVAPAAPGYPEHATLDDVPVDRFHYAPRRFETLAYTGTMASQVQASWSARLSLLGFLGAEFRSAVRARREFKPDVVHAHWWFPNGLVGTWLGRLANKPLVTTLHGSDVRLARAVAFSRPAFRHVLHRSAVVTAVSKWLAAEVQQVVSVPAPVVAPMPVATELFSPDGVAPRGSRLLFVGRLNKQKGIEILLHAMTKLPDASLGLDVVGDGEDRERLLQLATGLGLADRVTWHGAVPQDQLAAFYRRAAALVVPSVDEGLGLVAVEAQLCATPVVAFASGGLTDVVQDDRTGLLVPDVDAGALAAAIMLLLARADRGASLGAAGRLHALATFAPESVARRYADVYKSAIAASPK
ncbi:MAG TPA: glycosyltransferase [Gemmatimonadaceae bacterium]|jgi:glycosyltransferase involved in cell wall biosynthesis